MAFAQFLVSYAWRDLKDPSSRRSTLVALGTIAAAVAAALGGFGFAFGVERVSKSRLDADPFAKTLWTGSGTYGDLITPDALKQLRETVPPNTRVYPFDTVSVEFVGANGRSQGERAGRTISFAPGAEDDLFHSRPVRTGREITNPEDKGVVVTPRLMKELGYDPAAEPPKELIAYYDRNGPIRVPVLGLTSENLPLFHQFVITEEYVRDLGARYKDEPATVFTTRLPPEWTNTTALRAAQTAAAREAEDPELTLTPHEANFTTVWRVQLRPGRKGLTVRRWRTVLAEVERELRGSHPAPGAALALDDHEFAITRPPVPTDRDFVAVVAPTLDDIPAAATAISRTPTRLGEPLPVNSDIVEKLKRLNEQTRLMVRSVTMVEGFLVFIVVVNLLVVQTMRADRQIAEVGMLKAMGMSRAALFAAYALEAVMLWVPAALAGVGLGLGAVAVAAWGWYEDPREVREGIYWSWSLLGYVLGGSFVLTLGCVTVASARAVFASPSETLREGR